MSEEQKKEQGVNSQPSKKNKKGSRLLNLLMNEVILYNFFITMTLMVLFFLYIQHKQRVTVHEAEQMILEKTKFIEKNIQSVDEKNASNVSELNKKEEEIDKKISSIEESVSSLSKIKDSYQILEEKFGAVQKIDTTNIMDQIKKLNDSFSKIQTDVVVLTESVREIESKLNDQKQQLLNQTKGLGFVKTLRNKAHNFESFSTELAEVAKLKEVSGINDVVGLMTPYAKEGFTSLDQIKKELSDLINSTSLKQEQTLWQRFYYFITKTPDLIKVERTDKPEEDQPSSFDELVIKLVKRIDEHEFDDAKTFIKNYKGEKKDQLKPLLKGIQSYIDFKKAMDLLDEIEIKISGA